MLRAFRLALLALSVLFVVGVAGDTPVEGYSSNNPSQGWLSARKLSQRDISTCAPGTYTVVFATAGAGTWTLDNCFTAVNKMIVIGAGSAGADGQTGSPFSGAGGGAGCFSQEVNIAGLSAGGSIGYTVGAGSTHATSPAAGGDSWVCNATSNCASIAGSAVKAGAKGALGPTGGTAAAACSTASGVGSTKYAGGVGKGGSAAGYAAGSGGGTAGPSGAGKDAGTSADASSAASSATGGGGGPDNGTAGSNAATTPTGGAGGNGTVGTGGAQTSGAATPGNVGTGGGAASGATGTAGATGGAGAIGSREPLYTDMTSGLSYGPAGGSSGGAPGATTGGAGGAGQQCGAGGGGGSYAPTTPGLSGKGGDGCVIIQWTVSQRIPANDNTPLALVALAA